MQLSAATGNGHSDAQVTLTTLEHLGLATRRDVDRVQSSVEVNHGQSMAALSGLQTSQVAVLAGQVAASGKQQVSIGKSTRASLLCSASGQTCFLILPPAS